MKRPSAVRQQAPYVSIVIGSLVGGIAAFLQTIERIQWAEHPTRALICDINNAFSCSNVFGVWQSSVFGFSNALLCLTFFAVMLGFSIAVYRSKETTRLPRLIAQFFSLFFLCFGAWYITQLMFVVGSMCIYCAFCYAGVIAINWGWLRANVDELPLPRRVISSLRKGIAKGADTFAWLLYALVFVALFLFHFYL
jgi:uncharacterized membrane protein